MPTSELNHWIQYAMDLLGIFAFALSGALLSVRKDFDIFGTIALAEAAGLGGGLFRDLVIGVTPVAFADLGYYLAPLGAALIVFFGATSHHDGSLFDGFDAAALGLFSVTGTIKALTHGFGLTAAATLGVATAVGGGVISSLLALEVPPLLRWNRDLYALPALVGAGAVALLHAVEVLNVFTAVGAALAAFLLRLLALRRRWRTLARVCGAIPLPACDSSQAPRSWRVRPRSTVNTRRWRTPSASGSPIGTRGQGSRSDQNRIRPPGRTAERCVGRMAEMRCPEPAPGPREGPAVGRDRQGGCRPA